ncbi:NHL repeat-containing protein [Membranihabitans marinus]|uniref:6-bladed beta-propeller n=1 Tax=Membranihabitans marinus TaxID=1227546 RepID=UPI001F27DA3A|nr:6-bladed beta-propeller [Membranihabitans marinus]
MSNIPSRRNFIKQTSVLGSIALTTSSFNIITTVNPPSGPTIGHGDYKYKVDREWSKIDVAKFPVNNCHEMVMDRQHRLILLTDHPKNNILIYDKSGKYIDSWTLNFPGGHGLTLKDEGGEEYLYITDAGSGKVVKTDLKGRMVMEIQHPCQSGVYPENGIFHPTETAIAPNGDIYIADGYGDQFVLRYNAQGEFISKFGGSSFLQPDKFKQVHGVAIDDRDTDNITLLCSARIKNEFKRFSLDGEYIESYYIPGAFVSRPVIHDKMLYAGVCFGMTEDNYQMQLNRGFVTILDQNNVVVSNPGGSKPRYKNGKLKLVLQDQPIFKHCHDVCIDNDENLYVCQWNADKVYPYKLIRV